MRTEILKCPVCGGGLMHSADGKSLICINRHCFDIARKGYVNLLMRAGGRHGDDKTMLEARRDFLSRGHYLPIAEAVAEACRGSRLLDMGCGEGYYTQHMCLANREVYAFDVSGRACAMTAGRAKAASVFAASAFDIPVKPESVDCAVSIFAPYDAGEVRRVLNMGGLFVRVYPLPEHLMELKRAIYDIPRENPEEKTDIAGFSLRENQRLRYSFNMKSTEEIMALFAMTPYFYKTGRAAAERIGHTDSLECTAAVGVAVYSKE